MRQAKDGADLTQVKTEDLVWIGLQLQQIAVALKGFPGAGQAADRISSIAVTISQLL